MKVKRISWVGVGTETFDETLRFFTEVLGMQVQELEKPVAMLRAGPGQILEIFGEGSVRGKPLNSPPAIAFEVDDVAAAHDELVANGVEIVGERGSWDGHEWLYFRGPENYMFVVKKTPDEFKD
jgi:catechol 2,3-dioxygenase-like lactoylglutathione lyase family enzyme